MNERPYRIVKVPEVKPAGHKVSLPEFRVEPILGPDDPAWTNLGWPDTLSAIASEAEMESGILVIRYSTVFPKFASQRSLFENRDVALADSFTKRYEIWLVVHSLLHYQDQQTESASTQPGTRPFHQRREEDPELAQERERQERVRIAVMSAIFAAREVQMEPQAQAEP